MEQVFYPRHATPSNGSLKAKKLEGENKKIQKFNFRLTIIAIALVVIAFTCIITTIQNKAKNALLLEKADMLNYAVVEANSTIAKAKEEADIEVAAANLQASRMLEEAEEEASEIIENA